MNKKTYRPGWRTTGSRGDPTRRNTWISSNLKVILPLAVMIILAAIFLWPRIEKMLSNKQQPKTIERILKENPLLENKVIHPKFNSLDKKGRPFLVEAEFATNLNDEKTDFVKPSGNVKLDDGSTMSFSGDTGFYHKKAEMLEVFDHVHIKTDKGYDLKTNYMKLFPKENIGEGHLPIEGHGPSGETIKAEGFKITNKGDIIEFLGKTQISLPGSK